MLNFNDYLGYMAHEQEIEDIIQKAIELIEENEYEEDDFEIELPYYLSESEINYIKERLER